jgi:hypothetical protein
VIIARSQQVKPETSMEEMAAAAASASKPLERLQTWRKHGSCTAGTVPIRRPSEHANPEIAELVRRSSPFGRPVSSNGSYNLSVAAAVTQFGRRAGIFNQTAMAAPGAGGVVWARKGR